MAKFPDLRFVHIWKKTKILIIWETFLKWVVVQKVSVIAHNTCCAIQDIGGSMITSILLCDLVSETICSRGIPACICVYTADHQPLWQHTVLPLFEGFIRPFWFNTTIPGQTENTGCDTGKVSGHILKINRMSETKFSLFGHQLLPLLLRRLWR